jgi:hypothetical protein
MSVESALELISHVPLDRSICRRHHYLDGISCHPDVRLRTLQLFVSGRKKM